MSQFRVFGIPVLAGLISIWGGGAFVAVGDSGLVRQSEGETTNQVNSWTNSTSGAWEQPFWSLGTLPGPDQAGAAITNSGWKAVEIRQNTTAAHPESLSIRQLTVEAPQDSFNLLLLNYPGTAVPLNVSSDFVLGPNSSLEGFFAAITGGRMVIGSRAAFSDSSQIDFTNVVLGAASSGELYLTNSVTTAETLVVSLIADSTVTQASGVSQFTNCVLFEGGTFNLLNGWASTHTLDIQSMGDFPLDYGWQHRAGVATFNQLGGSMQSDVIRMGMQQPVVLDPNVIGNYVLSDGTLLCPDLEVIYGTFTQTGGTNLGGRMLLPSLGESDAQYSLSGGLVVSTNLRLGGVLGPNFAPGNGLFQQNEGVHSNINMEIWGEIRHQTVRVFGTYQLNGGTLFSRSNWVYGGSVVQSGGTNFTQELLVDGGGKVTLSGGQLLTSNATVTTSACILSTFTQQGGTHIVQNHLLLDDLARYSLNAGSLAGAFVEIGPGSIIRMQEGAGLSADVLILRGGALQPAGEQSLGKLQLIETPIVSCNALQPTNASLNFGDSASAAIRFADSHDVNWSGTGVILNYSPANQPNLDHIFFGSSSAALTPEQVHRLYFQDPSGWPRGSYPAQLLATGELIPQAPPLLAYAVTAGDLILTWPEDYLLLNATNVTGPYEPVAGATSPYTNTVSSPQRYFRLMQVSP